MQFRPELKQAKFLRRYKRFLADVELDGAVVTIHCPNTGSMKNCIVPNSPCWISESNNPKRKYRHTWELATTACGGIACINTQRANQVVEEAIANGQVPGLPQGEYKREVPYADKHRIDFCLDRGEQQVFVEVKSVTLSLADEDPTGTGAFPDAVSKRASEHLEALINCVAQGHQAWLIYCVQHNLIQRVRPASEIDPKYAETLRRARNAGVNIVALGCSLGSQEIVVNRSVSVIL